MSVQVPTAFVEQFNSNVTHLYQEGVFKLSGATRVESITGESEFFDQIGAGVMVKRTQRHAPTTQSDTRHDRRKVVTDPFDDSDLIDKPDQVRMLADMEGPYAQKFQQAMNRTQTNVCLRAANGTAFAKKNGATSVSSVVLPTGASATSQVIAVNYVAGQARGAGSGANTGMILDKLTEAKFLMDVEDTPEGDPRFIAMTAAQLKNMLDSITEVNSSDFNNVKALVEGNVTRFVGFNFIISNEVEVGTVGTDIASVIAWTKNAILLARAMGPTIDIGVRRDLSLSTQVFATIDVGATRMQENGVIQINCDQSP